MPKPWYNAYPPDVPHEIDPERYENINVLINEACAAHAGRPAFQSFGTQISFAEFDRLSTSFAVWLQQECGLLVGERVALMMPNMLAYPIALFGVLRAGGVVVNTNPQYTARELHNQLTDSGARIIVAFDCMLPVVAAVLEEVADLRVVVARIGDFMPWPKGLLFNRMARRNVDIPTIANSILLHEAVDSGEASAFEAAEISGDDLAFLQYTGGTTGRAKAAMLSHRNIVSNIQQVNAWYAHKTEPGREIIITALPLYHVYALTANCLAFMSHGGLNVLITDPRNLKTFIKTIRRVPFTALTGVNTLFNALLEQPGFASVNFSHLKLTSGGGMAVQAAVAERWKQVTGVPISEGYGLTEASPVVTANPPDREDFSGTIGLPVPSTEVSIRDDDGNEVDFDQSGELCVRGPQVMQGYWKQPEETMAVLDSNNWLRTGDIAVMREDGYLSIVDRKKDVIIVSGFNVYPNEVEDVAVRHPEVLEAAAIGIASDVSGESVRLVVVPRGDTLDTHALEQWCRQHLTGYKIPRSIVVAEALPKSNVGKILRRAVRDQFSD